MEGTLRNFSTFLKHPNICLLWDHHMNEECKYKFPEGRPIPERIWGGRKEISNKNWVLVSDIFGGDCPWYWHGEPRVLSDGEIAIFNSDVDELYYGGENDEFEGGFNFVSHGNLQYSEFEVYNLKTMEVMTVEDVYLEYERVTKAFKMLNSIKHG